MKKIVVVGGVAGGMSFATRYRRLNESDHIIVIDKGPYVSFANCGLPYYVAGEIENRSDLLVADRDMLENRFNLDIRTNHEVIAVDSVKKEITVKNDSEISTISYDSLVLSPGAKAFIPNEVKDKPNVHTVRNIPDVDAIMEGKDIKSALVIGAGFIGLEMVESFVTRGVKVNLVELADEVLAPFDPEMAIMARNELIRNGVGVHTGTSVKELKGNKAILNDGTELDADMVIVSVGVSPETAFLEGSGIELGMRGGIVVDEAYQTSVNDIYAVGDAIIVKNQINQEDALISLASPANRQGRQLADNLSGIANANKGSIGTAIVRIFDLSFASTGLNEKQIPDAKVIHLLGKSHAGYYPESEPIHMKVLFDESTNLILGAQAIGKKGADKRIDVIATAIKAGMSIDSLQELELSYAPPFGSAKDIVNMAGYVAHNIINGITNTVQWHEVRSEMNKGSILLDVRSKEERKTVGFIKGSIGIELDSLRNNLDLLDKSKDIIVHCQSGVRSYNAERILRQNGFNVRNLDGSFALYSRILPGEVESVL